MTPQPHPLLPARTRSNGPCPVCGSKDHTCKGENDTVPNVRAWSGERIEPGSVVKGLMYVPDHFSKGTVRRVNGKIEPVEAVVAAAVAVEAPEEQTAEITEEPDVTQSQPPRSTKQGARRKKRPAGKQASQPGRGGLAPEPEPEPEPGPPAEDEPEHEPDDDGE